MIVDTESPYYYLKVDVMFTGRGIVSAILQNGNSHQQFLAHIRDKFIPIESPPELLLKVESDWLKYDVLSTDYPSLLIFSRRYLELLQEMETELVAYPVNLIEGITNQFIEDNYYLIQVLSGADVLEARPVGDSLINVKIPLPEVVEDVFRDRTFSNSIIVKQSVKATVEAAQIKNCLFVPVINHLDFFWQRFKDPLNWTFDKRN